MELRVLRRGLCGGEARLEVGLARVEDLALRRGRLLGLGLDGSGALRFLAAVLRAAGFLRGGMVSGVVWVAGGGALLAAIRGSCVQPWLAAMRGHLAEDRASQGARSASLKAAVGVSRAQMARACAK